MKLLKIDKEGIWYETFAGDNNKITHRLIFKLDYKKLKSTEVLSQEFDDEDANELRERKILEIHSIEKLKTYAT